MVEPRSPYPFLALDLATRTGWASQARRGAPVEFGFFLMPKTGENVGWFIDAFEQALVSRLEALRPQTVAFEAPLFRTDGKSNISTARKLMGIANHTELVCYRRKIECFQANNASVKKHYTGNGRADPVRHVAFKCRQNGIDVGNDGDAAMAVALLSWMVAKLDPDQAAADTFGPAQDEGQAIIDKAKTLAADFEDPLAF